MKKLKILICLAAALILIATAFSACAPVRESEDDYVTYTLSNVVMTQTGINEYDFQFDVDSGSEDINVYLTERDRLKNTDVALTVTKTVNGQNAHVGFSKALQLSEEYYLWIVGEKEVMLPITAPSMFPSMEPTSGGVMFHFNYSYNVSWSSFCDPTGRAVYSSAKPTFDNDASVIRQGLQITEQDYIIPEAEFSADKYYYSVTTAKNGLLKIISAPVSLSDSVLGQIEDISAKLSSVGGVPTMTVSVVPADGRDLALTQASDLQLFVKNDVGDEIYSSTPVWDEGKAVMNFDCSNLIVAGKWYDVCFAYRGAMIGDVPVEWNDSNVGTSGSVTGTNLIKYSFADFEGQLKIYYDYPPVDAYDYCNYTVAFDEQSESLTVTVSKIFGNNPIPTLAITSGSTERLLEANYRISGGSYVYSVSLKNFGEAGIWYDVRLFFGNICAETIKDSAAQFGTEFTVGGRTYSFKEYDGLLKITYTTE